MFNKREYNLVYQQFLRDIKKNNIELPTNKQARKGALTALKQTTMTKFNISYSRLFKKLTKQPLIKKDYISQFSVKAVNRGLYANLMVALDKVSNPNVQELVDTIKGLLKPSSSFLKKHIEDIENVFIHYMNNFTIEEVLKDLYESLVYDYSIKNKRTKK